MAAWNPPVEYKKSGRLLVTVVSLYLHVLLEIHLYYQLLQYYKLNMYYLMAKDITAIDLKLIKIHN